MPAGSTATSADYTIPSEKLTIPARQRTGTISIRTVADEVLEPDETILVSLNGGTTAGTITATGTSRATTVRDGGATVLVAVAAQSQTVSEGEPARFVVSLSGTVSTAVTVAYATEDGVATEGDNDYTAAAATVTILAGKTSVTIAVATGDDDDAEENETFSVTLPEARNANLPAGVAIGTERATTTIRDDDPLTVSVTGPESVNAGSSPSGYRVELSGRPRQCRDYCRIFGGRHDRVGRYHRGSVWCQHNNGAFYRSGRDRNVCRNANAGYPYRGTGGVGIAAGEAEHDHRLWCGDGFGGSNGQ